MRGPYCTNVQYGKWEERHPSPAILPCMRQPGTAGHLAPPQLALLVLTAAWLVLFAPQLFARQVFVLGDARVYRPFSEYSRQRWLEQHERTYWNPYVMTGVAASASLADMRPQYLPDAALDLFERLRLGRVVPLAAPLIAHLLGMCAMAMLAWALWRPPTVALVWAGLAWGLSPLLLVPIAFGHTAYFVAASLAPAILLAVHATSRARTRTGLLGAGLALAGLAGLQVLTGHPQVEAYTGAAVVAFAIERAVRARRASVVIVVTLALAWGAAIAMAVWLPALLYDTNSVRGSGGVPLEAVRSFSIAWRELLAFAFPRIAGGAGETYWGGMWSTDYPRFFGTTVIVFALASLVRRDPAWREGRAFLAVLVLVAIGLSLGTSLGPMYAALRAAVPVIGRFRVTSMALVMAVPALALLSCAGVASALAGGAVSRPASSPSLAWVGLGVLLALGLLLLSPAASGYVRVALGLKSGFAAESAWRAAHAAGMDLVMRALLLSATLALILGRRRIPAAPVFLIAILALDLGAIGGPILRRASGPESALTAHAEPLLARFGRADHAARVLSTREQDTSSWQIAGLARQREMRTNDWIRWRARAYGGEHGTPSATWEETSLLGNSEMLRAMGIVYVSSPPGTEQDPSEFIEVARAEQEVVVRLRDALGRAYAVRSVRALTSEGDVGRAMAADSFRADSVAYTLEADAAGDWPGSEAARIAWLRDDPDELALRVDCVAPAFVVVADAWFPGWTATLDSAPVPVRRVDHSVRGVAVPAGQHELRMRYRPEGGSAGVRVTLPALVLWLLSALAWLAVRFTRLQSPSRAATMSSVPRRDPKTLSGDAPRNRK